MDPITQYLELARRRPELFVPSEHFPLFLDEVTLRRYAAATGRPVGVVYDNSPTIWSWPTCAWTQGDPTPMPG